MVYKNLDFIKTSISQTKTQKVGMGSKKFQIPFEKTFGFIEILKVLKHAQEVSKKCSERHKKKVMYDSW